MFVFLANQTSTVADSVVFLLTAKVTKTSSASTNVIISQTYCGSTWAPMETNRRYESLRSYQGGQPFVVSLFSDRRRGEENAFHNDYSKLYVQGYLERTCRLRCMYMPFEWNVKIASYYVRFVTARGYFQRTVHWILLTLAIIRNK